MKLPPSAFQSIISVPTAGIRLASTVPSWQHTTLPKHLLTEETDPGTVVPVEKQGDGHCSSGQARWLYLSRATPLPSEHIASVLCHWPSRRAESLAASWLINLCVTGHGGEGICHALLFGKQLAEFQLL